LDSGEPLSTEQLLAYLPALKEVPPKQLADWAKDAAVVHRYQRGDYVCREGEFGSTAFYVVSGSVDIFIASQIAHVKTHSGGNTGVFGRGVARMRSFLVSEKEEKRDGNTRTFIPIDASVDLSIAKPLAVLGSGELFGEMTCRTFSPRSATVRAAEDCVVVEFLRVVLDMLMGSRAIDAISKAGTRVKVPTFKGTSFKAEMDKKYRERSLSNHLRSVPLFSSLDEFFMDRLKQNVELVSFDKGDAICKQGEAADAFYLIRQGMVKVSQALAGGEMVRTYLGRGDYFGEIGLLKNQPRGATCSALDRVDVVRIKAAEFNAMLENFPDVRATLTQVADARIKAAEQTKLPVGLNMDEFLDQGLFEAQNLLLIDLDRCVRCDLCVRACADAHDGVTRLLRDGLRYDKYLVATACRTCRDPLCMTQCPVSSIRRKDNLEIIIEDWCIGCTKCAELCPFGNINMHPVELMEEKKAAAPQPSRQRRLRRPRKRNSISSNSSA
jgi:CRP-like cAMP-binding protein/Fe-S-cluster-containing hydrogenase component 2